MLMSLTFLAVLLAVIIVPGLILQRMDERNEASVQTEKA